MIRDEKYIVNDDQIKITNQHGDVMVWSIVGETENTFTVEKWGRITSIYKNLVKTNSNSEKIYVGSFYLPPVDKAFEKATENWVMEGVV